MRAKNQEEKQKHAIRYFALSLLLLLVLFSTCQNSSPTAAERDGGATVVERLRDYLVKQDLRFAVLRTYEHTEVKRVASVPSELTYRWSVYLDLYIPPTALTVSAAGSDSLNIIIDELALSAELRLTQREVEPADHAAPAAAAFWAREENFRRRVNTDFTVDANLRSGLRARVETEVKQRVDQWLRRHAQPAPAGVVVDLRAIQLLDGERVGFAR